MPRRNSQHAQNYRFRSFAAKPVLIATGPLQEVIEFVAAKEVRRRDLTVRRMLRVIVV
jgi:hypothetical protein